MVDVQENWIVIYCNEDDSRSIVPLSNVVCGPDTVTVGDEVKFNLKNKLHTGTIRIMGADYDETHKRMLELNKSKSKSESFHEERPRKAAMLSRVNVQTAIANMKGKRSQPHKSGPTDSEKKKMINTSLQQQEGILKAPKIFSVISSSDDSDSDQDTLNKSIIKEDLKSGSITDKDDASSDISANSLTEEEKNVLLKALAKKKRAADIKALLGNQSPKNVSTTSNNQASTSNGQASTSNGQASTSKVKDNSRQSSASSPTVDLQTSASDRSEADVEGEVKDTKKPNEVSKNKKLKSAKKRRRQRRQDLAFAGPMFLYKKNDDGTTELYEKSDVYVNKKDLDGVKGHTTTATALARRLIPLVFTREAMLACSVGGNAASGKGRRNITYRPPLDPNGVKAILEFTSHRAKKKGWTATSSAELRSKMACKLCEERATEEGAEKEPEVQQREDEDEDGK